MAAIIFDFDGTIIDSFDYFVDFLATEAKAVPLSHARRESLHGLSLWAVARRLHFPLYRFPSLYFKGRRLMLQRMHGLKAFPGMVEVVRKLHAEGHELFVLSSNGVENIREFLEDNGLHEMILEIYGGVVLFGKAPALRRLIRDQQLQLEDCWYVGDELRDIQAAQSIKLKSLAVTWGFARPTDLQNAHPTAIAEQPADIIRILEDF